MINAKNIPFAQLMATLEKVGAADIEGITIEQVTQIYNAVLLADTVTNLVDEIKAAAENESPTERGELVSKLSDIHMSITSLCTSLIIPMPEVVKAANAKITASNQPKETKAKAKPKEKQVDLEEAIKDKK